MRTKAGALTGTQATRLTGSSIRVFRAHSCHSWTGFYGGLGIPPGYTAPRTSLP
jgi:hypothetical protein